MKNSCEKNYTQKHLISPEEKLKYWGPGEWVEEPDVVEFDYEGYHCAVYRVMVYEGNPVHLSLGHLCGYVVISEGHPWYGKTLDSDIDPECHCGLSHCGSLEEGRFKDSDKFCIGFDCAHAWDLSPGIEALRKKYRISDLMKELNTITYKNINFVIEECKGLVEQAIASMHRDRDIQPVTVCRKE